MKPSSPPIDRSIAIAVLAAGLGKRFGGGKLDAILGEKPVAQWVTDAVEEAGFVRRFLVTGPEAPRFAVNLNGWERAINPAPGNGISGSIKTAANACHSCDRMIILLADMPFVEPSFLRSLTEGSRVTFTQYPGGRSGVPAAFPARAFKRFAELSGEKGAASIDWGEDIERLKPVRAASLQDFDTRDELSAAAREL